MTSVTGRIPLTQAERILDRFGVTAYGMARLLGRAPSSVYRWSYPRSRGGTAGVVPAHAMVSLAALARREGVLLRPEDFDPRPL